MKSEDFISVRLFGGLGNQIFQYMAGKSLAVDLKCKLHIDKDYFYFTGNYETGNNPIEFQSLNFDTRFIESLEYKYKKHQENMVN